MTHVVDTGRSAAVFALVGFVVTYGITRWITRTIRARNENKPEDAGEAAGGPVNDIYIGGVHIHHQVWGILLILTAGLLEFRFQPDAPWREVLAAAFGVGAALALDEFALWLHLEDVYWSEEGRKSIDAVMIATVFGLAMLVGTTPLGADGIVGGLPHRVHDHLSFERQAGDGIDRPARTVPGACRCGAPCSSDLLLGPQVLLRTQARTRRAPLRVVHRPSRPDA
jgi:hypothetical protein